MTTGTEIVLTTGKAVTLAVPVARKAARNFRTLRRTLGAFSFPEIMHAGVVATYKRRDAALLDIVRSVETSRCVRILSNKGDDWLGTHGHLSGVIRMMKAQGKRPDVRTLLMQVDAPWINAYEHGYRGKPLDRVREEFRAGHRAVLDFCREQDLAVPRFHKQAAIWRMVMTDQDAFVASYANHEAVINVPIIRFAAGSIVYESLRAHFDFAYDALASEPEQINRFERLTNKKVDFRSSAGLVCTTIKNGERKVLMLEKQDGTLALPKGGILEEEFPAEGALREFTEETGLVIFPTHLQLVGVYVTGQPFFSSVDVKVIGYFHLHEPGVRPENPRPDVHWLDANALVGARFAYDHVPDVLRKCGMTI